MQPKRISNMKKLKAIFILLLVATFACNQNKQDSANSSGTDSSSANANTGDTSSISGTGAHDNIGRPGSTFPGTNFSKEYIQTIARFAYVWGWPMVNSFNRRIALTSVSEPGLRGGVLPNAPLGHIAMLTDYIKAEQRFVACSNQDVTYGMGYGSLDTMPVIMQVPDFGDRFWVYAAWDARTDAFARLGKQYGTKPGFYLMVGPNWKGAVPQGVSGVYRSSTELAAFCPRVFLNDNDEDRKAIQPLLNQVMVYPITEFDGKMKTKDWKQIPSFPSPGKAGDEEIQWVPPATFFDQLPAVLKNVPPLPGEQAIYDAINAVLAAAQQDSSIKTILRESAIQADRELILPLKQWRLNGPPAGNGWNSPKNNGHFGTDYIVRTATAKSNMYENAFEETKYIFTDFDENGKMLNGNNLYSITFPAGQEPQVDGFWSLTLYNEHHFFNPNPLNRYSLGTKNTALKRNQDGSLTLYAGAASPGADKENNWIPAPKGNFSLYLRNYWPKQSIIDGSWQPPAVKRVK
jgi:hypothetical protein